MITVAITCWPNHIRRVQYLRRTVEALKDNLLGDQSALTWLVSAESERATDAPWAGDELQSVCDTFGIPLRWRQGPAHLAGHLNELFTNVFASSPLLLYIQDDWELTRALALAGHARHLESDPTLAGIRLWANTKYHDGAPPGYRRIDLASDWSYGDNPGLWHRRWWAKCGPFETHGPFANHEHLAAKTLAASGLQAWAPADVSHTPSYFFRHIGDVTSVPHDVRWPDAPKRSDQSLWT